MEPTRLETLQQMLQADPDNVFARYALALEFVTAGRDDEAYREFQQLLRDHPEYSATYYQAGKLLAKQGRRAEAQTVLERGIQVTGEQGKQHAMDELQVALSDLVS